MPHTDVPQHLLKLRVCLLEEHAYLQAWTLMKRNPRDKNYDVVLKYRLLILYHIWNKRTSFFPTCQSVLFRPTSTSDPLSPSTIRLTPKVEGAGWQVLLVIHSLYKFLTRILVNFLVTRPPII